MSAPAALPPQEGAGVRFINGPAPLSKPHLGESRLEDGVQIPFLHCLALALLIREEVALT